jgi:hypothetical protein
VADTGIDGDSKLECKRRLNTSSNAQSQSSPPNKKQKTTTTTTTRKDGEPMPTYTSQQHPYFQQLLKDNVDVVNFVDVNDLQQCIQYQHDKVYLDIQKDVFLLYMKSGNGTLDKTKDTDLGDINRCVWPTQVITAMIDRRATTTSHVPTDDDSCRQFVRLRLQEIDRQLANNRVQYDDIKQRYASMWPSSLNHLINDYVEEHGQRPLQMKCNLKVALLHFDARATILERHFTAQQPNEYQVSVICSFLSLSLFLLYETSIII